MASSLKFLVLFGIILAVSADRRYGGRCKEMRCAPSEQCIGFYEPCVRGKTEGTDCGSYPTCVQREGSVVHSGPSPSSGGGDRNRDTEKNTHQVSSTNDGDRNEGGQGQLYPSLPAQPNYPSNPQPQYPPQGGSGYPGGSPNVNSGGYVPPGYNPASGYPQAPGYPASDDRKKDSDSGSGFSSFLNFLSGGGSNRGSSDRGTSDRGGSSSSGGPDIGSLLSILSGAGGNNAGNSGGGGLSSLLRGGGGSSPAAGGAGGPDLRSLLNSFGGGGGAGSLENNALSGLINQFRGSGGSSGGGNNNYDRSQSPSSAPSGGQYGSSNGPSSGGNNPSEDSQGSGFLATLSKLAGQQILQRALQGNRDGESDSVQNRRSGGLFSENSGSQSPSSSGGRPRYPTQAPYSGSYPAQSGTEERRSYSSNDRGVPSGSTEKPVPYGWNVNVDQH